jgi:hypothetical protein
VSASRPGYSRSISPLAWGKKIAASLMPSSISSDVIAASLAGEDLKLFVPKNVDFCANRATYEKHFGSAMDNFLIACRTICAGNTNSRLTALIRNVFADSKLIDDLEPYTTKNPDPVRT